MGMTIDEVILTIKNAIHFTYDEVYEEAFAMAIETMRKYQKIEQILKEPCIIPEGCYPKLEKIKRVIKDEN